MFSCVKVYVQKESVGAKCVQTFVQDLEAFYSTIQFDYSILQSQNQKPNHSIGTGMNSQVTQLNFQLCLCLLLNKDMYFKDNKSVTSKDMTTAHIND